MLVVDEADMTLEYGFLDEIDAFAGRLGEHLQMLASVSYTHLDVYKRQALQKSTSIGLVVPEASFTYTGQVINGLIDVAKIYNYNIMLHTITAGITDINTVIEDIIKSHVDGVVTVSYTHLCSQEQMHYSMSVNLLGLV